jgi:dolichol-phosphate mannosyltransferase
MRTLQIISPVFEEEATIEIFHSALKIKLASLEPAYSSSILYVCDPGRDQTQTKLRGIAAEDRSTRVICLSRRFGHQASLLAGLDFSDADIVITMDCDMQHPPEVISNMLEAYQSGAEIVQTFRIYDVSTNVFKRITSRFYYRLLQALSDTPVYENAADFRLVSRRVVTLFRTSIRERNQFLRGLFSWVGFKQAQISFRSPPRLAGETKYSLGRMIRLAVAGIISSSVKPLRYSIYIGLLTAFLGFVLVTITIFQRLFGSHFPAGWATLIALISMLGGAQLVFLGVLGEYVAYISDDVKARPIYIVDYKLNFNG